MNPRMSLATAQVLSEMLKRPADEFYGMELIKATGIPSGSLYPIMMRLEDHGWVTSHWEDLEEGKRKRKFYRFTPLGERRATEEVNAISSRIGGIALNP